MTMKGYSTLSKSPELKSQTIFFFVGKILTPLQNIQSVYSMPHQNGGKQKPECLTYQSLENNNYNNVRSLSKESDPE